MASNISGLMMSVIVFSKKVSDRKDIYFSSTAILNFE